SRSCCGWRFRAVVRELTGCLTRAGIRRDLKAARPRAWSSSLTWSWSSSTTLSATVSWRWTPPLTQLPQPLVDPLGAGLGVGLGLGLGLGPGLGHVVAGGTDAGELAVRPRGRRACRMDRPARCWARARARARTRAHVGGVHVERIVMSRL